MKFLVVLVTVSFVGFACARSIPSDEKNSPVGVPYNEELIVESSLNVLLKNRESSQRVKRQFGGFNQGFNRPSFGQSSSQANANAFNQQFGPNGFGASAANAAAQGFVSQGPLGGFGANSANTQTQGFHAGPGGFGANAALSGSQNYHLPNGQNLGVSYGGTYANNNGQVSNAQSSGITFS